MSSLDLAGEIRDPRLKKLHDYWQERRRGRRLPARHDIDPLDFSYILGHLLLVDVLGEPLRFRIRLHGVEMVDRAGYDLTGKFVDDLPDSDFRSYVLERCQKLVEAAQPIRIDHARALDGRMHRYEALWLPFSDDGSTVTMLMCALVYQPEPEPTDLNLDQLMSA